MEARVVRQLGVERCCQQMSLLGGDDPSLYLSSMRPAIFAGVMEVEQPGGDRRTLQTMGVQLDWNCTMAHRLPMVLSLAYAEGFDEGERQGSEVLVSLKIM